MGLQFRKTGLLVLCCVWHIQFVRARDPLYASTATRARRLPLVNTDDASHILLASAQPWRRPSSSHRNAYRQDYSTRFMDWETCKRDSRTRVWSVNFKTRNLGKLSWTSRLVYANIIMFALQALRPSITSMGMKLSERILKGEQLYRLVTPVFLHGSILHLMTNMISLQRSGNDLEKLFGPGRYISTYVAAGAAGNLLSAINSPNPSLGASGAVFGVFGAYFVFLTRNEWIMGSYGQAMTTSIVQTIAANVFLGMMNPVIDNWAHLGGALGGAAMAYAFGPKLFLTELPGGGRVVVDRPVYRLPRSVERLAQNTGNQVQRVAGLVPPLPGRSNKPWRKPGGKSKFLVPTPNKSIKPKDF